MKSVEVQASTTQKEQTKSNENKLNLQVLSDYYLRECGPWLACSFPHIIVSNQLISGKQYFSVK